MHRGYIAVWRKIQDHEFFREKRVFSKFEAWLDLLMEAQHNEEPQQVMIGMQVLYCNYGETLKSNCTWAHRWGWTESKVRRFFNLLEKMNQIRRKNEGVTTRVSVINYSNYDPRRRANNEEATRTRRGSDEQATTDKNVNNVKNVKNEKEKGKKPSPNKPKNKSQSKFTPPTEAEVESYFIENGYSPHAGKKAHQYYAANDWKDARGNPVKNWKQKMISVWFKPENEMSKQQVAGMSRKDLHNVEVLQNFINRGN